MKGKVDMTATGKGGVTLATAKAARAEAEARAMAALEKAMAAEALERAWHSVRAQPPRQRWPLGWCCTAYPACDHAGGTGAR
jgi:hypothetical protein